MKTATDLFDNFNPSLQRSAKTPRSAYTLSQMNTKITEDKMKAFDFVAFNSSGKKKLGTVRARSLSEAKRKIQRKGFYLASIEIKDSSVSNGQNSFSFLKELKEFFFSKEKINV